MGDPICSLLSGRPGREEPECGAAEAGPGAEVVVGASATDADAARGLARVRGSLPGVRSGYAVSAEMVSPRSGRGSQAEVAGGGGGCLVAGARDCWGAGCRVWGPTGEGVPWGLG